MPSGPGQIELIAEIAAEKAVLAAEPFGLDLCSSVRSDGILDESKLKAFFSALWSMQPRRAKS
jgi:phosphoribosylanthranilate isomerase